MWRLLRLCFPEAHSRRRVPIRDFTANFASHRLKLVIEVDGGQHGGRPDEVRTALIEAEGYRVVRFWNHDVLCNGDGVAAMLAAYCGDSTPTMNRFGSPRDPKPCLGGMATCFILPHRGGGG